MFLSLRKYGIGTIYDVGDKPVDASKLELDPVDCCGVLKLDKFKKSPGVAMFVLAAIALLTDHPPELFSEITIQHGLHVSDKYARREKELSETRIIKGVVVDGIIVKENRGNIKCLSSYFEVVKERNGVFYARMIFNGKNLSTCTSTPDPVNLPEIPDFLQAASELHDEINKKVSRKLIPHCISSDLRHWFHEIPVSKKLSVYFGLAFSREKKCDENDGVYRWRTLPMGWATSPRIAQCLSWGLILSDWGKGVPFYLKHAADECRNSRNPPRWIYICDAKGERCGITTVWYDNVISLIWNNDIAFKFESHLRDAEKSTSCVWKEVKHWSPDELNEDTIKDDCGIFLGLQIAFSLERGPANVQTRRPR